VELIVLDGSGDGRRTYRMGRRAASARAAAARRRGDGLLWLALAVVASAFAGANLLLG
jgi:hypothetical protein